MAEPKNEKEVIELADDMASGYSPIRMEFQRQIGIDACYDAGVQWIRDHYPEGTTVTAADGTARPRLPTDYSPDSPTLRVADNQIAFRTQKVAAGTRPRKIEIDASPKSAAVGIEAEHLAFTAEKAVQAQIEESNFVEALRACNERRTKVGTWGLLLGLRYGVREIDGEEMPDKVMYATDFDPSQLILDPHERDRNLARHDCVILEDVWTARKLRETFPKLKFDEKELSTVADLVPQKLAMNSLGMGRIYQAYQRISRSKAAFVRQMHCKDRSGRHTKMFVIVQIPGQKDRVVNMDDPTSPFGGCGLPLQLFYGHWRFDTIIGLSDTAMMRPNQDMLNLSKTLYFRIVQKYGAGQWRADRRAYPSKATDAEIAATFSTMPGWINFFTSGDRTRPVNPPELIQYPEPPQFLARDADTEKEEIRKKSHKSAASFGPENLKSHVTEGAAGRAFDDAGDVEDGRIEDDIASIERLVGVIYGTTINCLNAGYPSTAAMLSVHGFQPDDYTALVADDPHNSSVSLKVRESTVRHRSHQQRRVDLDNGVTLGYVAPEEARDILAGTLETPISHDDSVMAAEAVKAARNVKMGHPWMPRRLGRYSLTFIAAFRRAGFDPGIQPDAIMRLEQAIAIQQQVYAEEMAIMAPPSEKGQPAPEEPEQPELGPEASPADVLDMATA